MNFDNLRDLTWQAITFRVTLSAIIGGLIGIERRLKNQPAGSKTYMIVSLGACLVMMTNQYLNVHFGGGDPARLGAQVVSGIGFLGAGTIIVTRNRQVKGLTTAAGLWASACIGLAIGIGFYEGAIAAGVMIMLIMTVFKRMEEVLEARTRYYNLYINLSSSSALNSFMDFCKTKDILVVDLQVSKGKGQEKGDIIVFTVLKTPRKFSHDVLLLEIQNIGGVKHIQEI